MHVDGVAEKAVWYSYQRKGIHTLSHQAALTTIPK
jgi:hypothetical protein